MLYGREGGVKISLKSHFLSTSNRRGSFLTARVPPRGTTRYPLCNLQDGHHLSVLLERDLLVAPGQKGWVSRELAEMGVQEGSEEVGGVSDDCLISLREAGESFTMCLDKGCVACPVSIGQETLRDWDLNEVLAGL